MDTGKKDGFAVVSEMGRENESGARTGMLFAHPRLMLLPEGVHGGLLRGRHTPHDVDAGAVLEYVDCGHGAEK